MTLIRPPPKKYSIRSDQLSPSNLHSMALAPHDHRRLIVHSLRERQWLPTEATWAGVRYAQSHVLESTLKAPLSKPLAPLIDQLRATDARYALGLPWLQPPVAPDTEWYVTIGLWRPLTPEERGEEVDDVSSPHWTRLTESMGMVLWLDTARQLGWKLCDVRWIRPPPPPAQTLSFFAFALADIEHRVAEARAARLSLPRQPLEAIDTRVDSLPARWLDPSRPPGAVAWFITIDFYCFGLGEAHDTGESDR